MNHQRGKRPSRVVCCLLLVDVETPRARAIESGSVVVTPGRGILRVFRHTHNFKWLGWDGNKVVRGNRHDATIKILQIGDHICTPFVGIRKLVRGVFHDDSHPLGKALAGDALAIQNIQHFTFDSVDLGKPCCMNFIGGILGGRVRLQFGGVNSVAIWQSPDARIMGGLWQH